MPSPKVMTATNEAPIDIQLYEDHARISQDINGMKSEKIVSIDTIVNVFKSLDTTINIPLLPLNCRKMIKKGQTVYVFMEYPEAVLKEFKYKAKKIKDLTVPKCMVVCTLNDLGNENYAFRSATFFAIKESILNNEDTELFWWPFSHQSHNYMGAVCWGTNPVIPTLSKSCSLFAMSSIYQMYFSSEFLDDYGFNFSDSSAGNATWAPMPEYYKGDTPFPYDKLKPYELTMKKLIKKLMANP